MSSPPSQWSTIHIGGYTGLGGREDPIAQNPKLADPQHTGDTHLGCVGEGIERRREEAGGPCGFPWGDVKKCLFTPDRAWTTGLSNHSSEVQRGEAVSFLGYLQSMNDSKAAGPLRGPPRHGWQPTGCIPGALCTAKGSPMEEYPPSRKCLPSLYPAGMAL